MSKNFFEEVLETAITRQDQVMLSEVSKVEIFEDKAFCQGLSKLYLGNLNLKLLAVIFNAVVTQNKITFLMSKRILANLVSKDPNLDRNSLSGQEFKQFMTYVRNEKLLEVIIQGQGFGQASVVEAKHEYWIDVVSRKVSREFLAAQRENCIKIHKTSQGTSHQTSHDIMNNDIVSSDVGPLKQTSTASPLAVASGSKTQQLNTDNTAPSSPKVPLKGSPSVNEEHKALISKGYLVPNLNAYETRRLDEAALKIEKFGSLLEVNVKWIQKLITDKAEKSPKTFMNKEQLIKILESKTTTASKLESLSKHSINPANLDKAARLIALFSPTSDEARAVIAHLGLVEHLKGETLGYVVSKEQSEQRKAKLNNLEAHVSYE